MVPVDRVVSDGDTLWETLRAIELPGGSPGETAYHAPGVLVIGDAVTNLDGLQVLPEKYCATCRCCSVRCVLPTVAVRDCLLRTWTSGRRQSATKLAEII